MRYSSAVCAMGMIFIAACRPPDSVHQYVPASPDLAIYGGVFFQSKDGLNHYEKIVILPAVVESDVAILFPDGASVAPKDLTPDILRLHGVTFELDGDDGEGNFSLIGTEEMQATFRSHRPQRISLYCRRGEQGPFPIRLNGHEVGVWIERDELEAILGKPDDIKYDTTPEEVVANKGK